MECIKGESHRDGNGVECKRESLTELEMEWSVKGRVLQSCKADQSRVSERPSKYIVQIFVHAEFVKQSALTHYLQTFF